MAAAARDPAFLLEHGELRERLRGAHVLRYREGRVDDAIEHLELGRQLAPQDPTPCLLLATAYRKRGQLEQARAMMDRVAKLNEEQAEKRRLAFDKNQ